MKVDIRAVRVELKSSSSLTVKTNSFDKKRDIFLSVSQNTRCTCRLAEYRTSACFKMCSKKCECETLLELSWINDD